MAASAWSEAAPQAVWDALADVPSWPRWTTAQRASYEREGVPVPGGVGAIRRIGVGPMISREEIVAFEPPRKMSYTMLSGMPVKNYLAHVELRDERGGTAISWTASFDPKVPGTGPVLRLVLAAALKKFAKSLARFAASPSS